jgi:hypothetical protein
VTQYESTSSKGAGVEAEFNIAIGIGTMRAYEAPVVIRF